MPPTAGSLVRTGINGGGADAGSEYKRGRRGFEVNFLSTSAGSSRMILQDYLQSSGYCQPHSRLNTNIVTFYITTVQNPYLFTSWRRSKRQH